MSIKGELQIHKKKSNVEAFDSTLCMNLGESLCGFKVAYLPEITDQAPHIFKMMKSPVSFEIAFD